MKKTISVLILFLLQGSLFASSLQLISTPTECIPELKRFDVTGTTQRKAYKLDQNKRQRQHHQNHAPQYGGTLIYIQDQQCHIEAVIDKDTNRFLLFFSDENLKSMQMSNVRMRLGGTNTLGQYSYFKLTPKENQSLFEIVLPKTLTGTDLELELWFSNQKYPVYISFPVIWRE